MQRFSGLFLAAACCLAQAQEVVVSGHVEKIYLLPRGAAECPDVCPPAGGPTVCISNDCGCEVTDIKVNQVLHGADPGALLQVKSRLGEWCRPTFPIKSDLLLIQVKDGRARWSPIEKGNGVESFDAKPFVAIGSVPAASLKQEQGKVTIDELRKVLRESH